MKRLLASLLMVVFSVAIASAQSNKIVFGPLEGDDAGILRCDPGDTIEVEMWVRTDPDNPAAIVGVNHSLMSEDSVIFERLGVTFDSSYGQPNWESAWVDGPFIHDPQAEYPIPEGYTSESAVALYFIFNDPVGDPLDTGGEWDFYGSFDMVVNIELPDWWEDRYPFSSGWYPHSGNGTDWVFENPPGGNIIPDQDFCGIRLVELAIEDEDNLPAEFSLDQNYPNPFNATTTIQYSLREESNVTIEIYDIMGRKVETLVAGEQPAGYHQVAWDASNHSSGMYFFRIQAGDYAETRKMVLLK